MFGLVEHDVDHDSLDIPSLYLIHTIACIPLRARLVALHGPTGQVGKSKKQLATTIYYQL